MLRNRGQKKEDGAEELVEEYSKSTKKSAIQNFDLEAGTYWLTRVVFLRAVAFVYFVAFLVAFNQNKELIGQKGLTPAPLFLNRVKSHYGGKVSADLFMQVPTLFWFVDYQNSMDLWLDFVAATGMLVSLIVLLTGAANMVLMITLWILYHSLVNVGQRWYSFGWESQLLETGFIAILFCPTWTSRRLPRATPPPWVAVWAGRWLIFRIMLGAGLIKIRGDRCWRDLTCMNYHYLTQPVPNPMAYFMHQEPEPMHKFEVLSNHFIELLAPFLLLPILPRVCMLAGGCIQIFFQIVLIISGNLSFLNWLTIIPSICCLDDRFLQGLFSSKPFGVRWQVYQWQNEERHRGKPRKPWGAHVRRFFNLSTAVLIVYLSLPVVQNLLSSRQHMNTSFDPLRLVNTYGAFGSVTKERTEIVLEGTLYSSPDGPDTKWLEYEFNCKPGAVKRRPCVISPYHYRLDWLMWFAAFQNYQQNDWLLHLVAKLLTNDSVATGLLAKNGNPFQGKKPPKFIRAVHYRYHYTTLGSKSALEGQWWRRKRIGEYIPTVSLEQLKPMLKAQGWPVPRLPK